MPGVLVLPRHVERVRCVRQSQHDNSRVSRALSAVAERQLQIDTNHARLLKDASIREEQFFAAIDAVEDEIAVYDSNGILVVTNRAFANRCTAVGSIVAPGMLQIDVLNALAKSPGAGMPLNEREGWLTVQTDRRSEALPRSSRSRLAPGGQSRN